MSIYRNNYYHYYALDYNYNYYYYYYYYHYYHYYHYYYYWGSLLKNIRPKIIVAIAPLKISVSNLEQNLDIDSDYKSIIVDSDSGATTDAKEIEDFFNKNFGVENIIVYSTYKSAVQKLNKIMKPEHFENAFVLVDEV